MVLESGRITQEGIDRPRQYGVGLFNEDASRSAIRHFCQGIGDSNPLYWDVSFAQQSNKGIELRLHQEYVIGLLKQ